MGDHPNANDALPPPRCPRCRARMVAVETNAVACSECARDPEAVLASARAYAVKLRGTPTGPRSYVCDAHGAFELEVDLATSADPRPCPTCEAPCPRTIDRPLFKPQRGRVLTGASQEPPPLAMDCTKLADGMDPDEWRADLDRRVFNAEMDELKKTGALG